MVDVITGVVVTAVAVVKTDEMIVLGAAVVGIVMGVEGLAVGVI